MNKRWIDELSGTVLYFFSILVYKTCRLKVDGIEKLNSILEKDESLILSSWHGMTMMVISFIKNYLDIRSFAAIMPDDHRGRALEVFANHLGAEAIQLNLKGDQTLESGKKLVRLIRKISKGKKLLIHPDGPEGPAYRVKPGVTFLAGKANAVILPLGCYCRHAFHIPRWDRYTLPLPFSKIHIYLGNPIRIDPVKEDLKNLNNHLRNVLNQVAFQAAANYYEC